jgi:DNA-binding NarL/FixJ family response regulator
MINVLVADDQHLIREGLVALLGMVEDITVVGAATDGAQAVRLARSHRPDVVLMDLRMPVLDGVDATRELTNSHPGIAVLVLTTYADDESIIGALRAGARGYLTKDAGRKEIAAAVRSAVAGHPTYDAAVSRKLVAALTACTGAGIRAANLTVRETEVLRLIADGLSNSQIAAELYIGETTVKTHINNVFAKISAKNRADAVRYAFRIGLTR